MSERDAYSSGCFNNMKCTGSSKTATELLTQMEEVQARLHDEVTFWKIRFLQGIGGPENQQRLYDLLQQFSSLHCKLDAILEREKVYLFKMQQREERDDEADKELGKQKSKDISSSKTKALKKRIRFFRRVHEHNVELLFSVLGDVEACRKMMDFTKRHRLSGSLAPEIRETTQGSENICV